MWFRSFFNQVRSFPDCAGGRRGHDDVTEGRQERSLLRRDAGLAAHRVPQLQDELRIHGKNPKHTSLEILGKKPVGRYYL